MMPECKSLLPPVSPGLKCIIIVNNQYAAALNFHNAPRAESKSFISMAAGVLYLFLLEMYFF